MEPSGLTLVVRFRGAGSGSVGSAAAAATAEVAALVSDSALPSSSVKDTRTLMALPALAVARV